jgi:lipopolysaccharide export system permease protein
LFVILRYLTVQLFTSMLTVVSVLLMVFMSGRFIKYLGEAASGKISSEVLFSIMAYRLPGYLELILPLGLFLGILLSYGRMYLESEMTILFACGVSKVQLVMLTLFVSLIVTLLVATISLYVTPWGMQQALVIVNEQAKKPEFELLVVPGRFQSHNAGGKAFYAEQLSENKKEMQGVFFAEKNQNDGTIAVSMAQRATFLIDEETDIRFLVFHEGVRYQGKPGELELFKIDYETYGVKFAETANSSKKLWDETIPTNDLLGSESPKDKALLQWRISLSLLVPIVSLLAIPLSRVSPRQGRFFHLIPAMLIYVTYLGLLIMSKNNLEIGKIPMWLGMWWVHVLFLAIALLLLFSPDWSRLVQSKKIRAQG